ncbi:MAG: hypothetical protein JXR96_14530 [Deltaproteobacteria bacterium]|nr:hypothetical protein [Deltaproteobacteria bacterium]
MRKLVKVIVILLVAYLLFGAAVTLRSMWRPPPSEAARAYLTSVARRDLPGIYLYSDMLGAKLAGMMADSGLSEAQRKHMWAKDYARWKREFERGTRSMDSIRRERQLLRPDASIVPVEVEHYKATLRGRDGEESLASYRDVPGQTHHVYFKIEYASADKAPPVGILNHVQGGKDSRIRSVVVRVEVRLRPEVKGLRALLLEQGWMDRIAFLVPFRDLLGHDRPASIWMAGVSFDVDRMTLETF